MQWHIQPDFPKKISFYIRLLQEAEFVLEAFSALPTHDKTQKTLPRCGVGRDGDKCRLKVAIESLHQMLLELCNRCCQNSVRNTKVHIWCMLRCEAHVLLPEPIRRRLFGFRTKGTLIRVSFELADVGFSWTSTAVPATRMDLASSLFRQGAARVRRW